MVKRLVYLPVIVATCLSLGLMAPPARAYNPLGGACSSTDASGSSAACNENNKQVNNPDNPNPVSGPSGVIQVAANIIAAVAGIVAVAMIIVSGIRYSSAAGNPEKAKKARANLMSAIIGLIIVALAWTIITFVVKKIVQ